MAILRGSLGDFAGGMNTVISSAAETFEHTTSGTAGPVASLSATPGQVFAARCTGACWIRFGGNTAAVGTGHFFGADEWRTIGVTETGAISVIDDS